MVFIGTATQTRLLEAAKREFGPRGETLVRDAVREALNLPLEQVEYVHLPRLFDAIGHAASSGGRDKAAALAGALDELRTNSGAGLRGRLISLLSAQLGPAAEPFLRSVCGRLGIDYASVDAACLPRLAEAVAKDGAVLLGEDGARQLAVSVRGARTATPRDLAIRLVALAREHVGPEGEDLLRALCRERLEVELEALDLDGAGILAEVVRDDGPERFSRGQPAPSLTLLRQAVNSPAESLRHELDRLMAAAAGPLGPEFLREICARHAVPFDAIDHEHLMWLAEVLRGEMAPLMGKAGADNIARDLRGILTGRR